MTGPDRQPVSRGASRNAPATYSNLHPQAQSLAQYVATTYGVRFPREYGGGWRPKGSVAGETGVHSTGNAFDIPVDQNSKLGQQIAADLRGKGFYVYTKQHGTGPHLHVEIDRNPDGSAKR